MGNYKAISTAVRESYDWRPIDILINNAGITRSGFIEEVSVEDLNEVVQTNLLGSLYPLHAALTDLKMRSRSHPISIVFIGSLASLVSINYLTPILGRSTRFQSKNQNLEIRACIVRTCTCSECLHLLIRKGGGIIGNNCILLTLILNNLAISTGMVVI